MSKATKYNETTAFAAIREAATADGVTAAGVVVAILEAGTVLEERLILSPVVAARCEKRGEAAKVAREAIAVAKAEGFTLTRDAAAQAVTRIVKVGRVLAAHPTMDRGQAFTLTNRATTEAVDKAVAAKDAEEAATALGRKPKAAGTGKAPKAKTPESVRENTHNTVAAAIEYILTTATEEQARAFYNTLASDLKPLAAALTGGTHAWADVVTAEADAEADAEEAEAV